MCVCFLEITKWKRVRVLFVCVLFFCGSTATYHVRTDINAHLFINFCRHH